MDGGVTPTPSTNKFFKSMLGSSKPVEKKEEPIMVTDSTFVAANAERASHVKWVSASLSQVGFEPDYKKENQDNCECGLGGCVGWGCQNGHDMTRHLLTDLP